MYERDGYLKKKKSKKKEQYEIWKTIGVLRLREYEIRKFQRTKNVTISFYFLVNINYEDFYYWRETLLSTANF